jgi:hypothetical protein
MSGKYTPVSHFRRLVADLMHFSMKVPAVTVERHLDLARLVAARRALAPAPTWSSIFTKAYATVAARAPALRTSYLASPRPRFYEHPANVATLNVDRQLADERVVIYAHIASPESLTLQELDEIIRRHQDEPVTNIPSYRSAVRLSRVPWPFRRWVWWAALNISGPTRCRNFGTFAVSSVGSQGAGITRLLPLLTSQLHYGMIDATGRLEMRLSFDHRVLDGGAAAGALADLEAVLLGEVLDECLESAGPRLNGAACSPEFARG